MNLLQQTTDHVLMVRPARFAYNPQTAINNAFQKKSMQQERVVHQKALAEFDRFVRLLRKQDINVTVVQDTLEPHTPDSIFPNNVFSLHHNGTLVLYPMFAPNRRLERKQGIRSALEKRFVIEQVIDLTHYEDSGKKFLEGTGSMVLDHVHRIAYACHSPRTHVELFLDFCKQLDYSPILFNAIDRNGQPVYHTNVMMCIASDYMIVCLESIPEVADRKRILSMAETAQKEVISIDMFQLEQFAGNMLQLRNSNNKPFIVLSATALRCLMSSQIEKITHYNTLLTPDIPTIEENGGGSVRCMIAECFAHPK